MRYRVFGRAGLNVSEVVFGGVYGAVTGGALVWLLRKGPPGSAVSQEEE